MSAPTGRTNVALADDFAESATFRTGHIDKLDVLAIRGDALVQFQVGGSWLPAEGLPITRGLFESWAGLSLSFEPSGPTGVRFKRRTPGVASSVNFKAWSAR